MEIVGRQGFGLGSLWANVFQMKIFYILLLCLCCGCASTDMQTINLLNQRLNALEKQIKSEPVPIQRDVYPNRLNDAQKDFVEFMLNYLSEESD